MALEDLEYNVQFLWDTFMVPLCPFPEPITIHFSLLDKKVTWTFS